MTNTIRIKRGVANSSAPASLANAELAFNEITKTLYYGLGTGGAGGSASQVIPIGGEGAFVGLVGDQSIDGVKTFTQVIVGSISGNAGTVTNGVYTNGSYSNPAWLTALAGSKITGDIGGNAGTATKLATARTIAFTGDATASGTFDGSANYSQAITLATVNSNVGSGFTKVTVNAKGLVTEAGQASLSDLAAPSADFDFGGFKITGVGTPTADSDAATKAYVDSVAQGLNIKASVRAATTANITLSGAQTIDGVAVVAGDRVLVKNQSTTAENGIYVAASGAWARAADANVWSELVSAFTFVEEGTVNHDTGWTCTVNQGGTIGTTAVTFTQFSGAGSYLAGNGISLTGSTFAVVANGSTIDVSSSGIKLSDTYAGQASIVTVGTIGTGTWQGSAIGIAYGGLGRTTLVAGLVKGAAGAYGAAVAGTDYLDPNSTVDGGTF